LEKNLKIPARSRKKNDQHGEYEKEKKMRKIKRINREKICGKRKDTKVMSILTIF